MNVALLVFIATLTGSFGVSGYLLLKSSTRQAVDFGSTPVEQLLATAETLVQKQQTEQALVMYRKILAAHPKSLDAQLALARGELMAGREDVAAQEYESALRLDQSNTIALRQLAKIYSHQRTTWALAEAKFKQYLTRKPDDVEAHVQLARLLIWEGKWREAADIYSRPALARLLTIEDKRSYVGALAKSGQTQRAEVVVKGFLAGGRPDFELQLQLASLYASRQDWDSALPLFRSLLQAQPNDPQLNLTYGVGLLSTRDYRAALGPLLKARNGMPSNPEAGLSYARALRGVKEYKPAAKEFERILPTYARDAEIVREYADLLLEKGDYRAAEAQYRQAYDLGLRDIRLLVSFSGALRANGKPRAALPYLEEAYRRQSTDRLALELAKLLRELGRYDEAKRMLATIEPASARAER
ncbi:MAG: tetratricopeptide repeat protein [Candidatus Rokuibacteriota bacterium]